METFAIWIVARRARRLFRHPASYKRQLRVMVVCLEKIFWNKKNALSNVGNRIAYQRIVREMRRKQEILSGEGKPTTLEALRSEYEGNINSRTQELLHRLIDEQVLRPDTDEPPSFRMVGYSMIRMLPLFKWVILEVLILGIVVVTSANLLSEYLIRRLFGSV